VIRTSTRESPTGIARSTDDPADIDTRSFVEAVFDADETCSWCAAPLFDTYDTPGGTRRDPAPEAGEGYFPPTTVDGRQKRGGKRTYCGDCGRTEPPAAWENRTARERHEHLDHVLEFLAVESLDTEAAHDTVSRLNRRDDVADLEVLAAAVDASLRLSE
jgi:hypothetical protein